MASGRRAERTKPDGRTCAEAKEGSSHSSALASGALRVAKLAIHIGEKRVLAVPASLVAAISFWCGIAIAGSLRVIRALP